jgi:hypothetical protein
MQWAFDWDFEKNICLFILENVQQVDENLTHPHVVETKEIDDSHGRMPAT